MLSAVVFTKGRQMAYAPGYYSELSTIVVVGLGRRQDGSRIVVSVDVFESGSTAQFSTHMFVHRFGMGSMRRYG